MPQALQEEVLRLRSLPSGELSGYLQQSIAGAEEEEEDQDKSTSTYTAVLTDRKIICDQDDRTVLSLELTFNRDVSRERLDVG